MLDYKLLEALAAVVQEGGFDRAARRLHITQSAVSQRIRLLEDQAGQILLARTSPPKPTSAGHRMLRHYLQVKKLEDDLQDELSPSVQENFVSIAVGVNADSLATWLVDALRPFLEQEQVLLDFRVDDQEQTHQFLRDGEVMGCISVREQAMQGCSVVYLGRMDYRLTAAPEFAARWFPDGLAPEAAGKAPAVIYNRRDDLHNKLLRRIFGDENPPVPPAHYLPLPEKFAEYIVAGFACGMLPDQQSAPFIQSGQLLDIASPHHIPVSLYWHCWNLKSRLLETFTRHLVSGSRRLLPR